MSLDTSALILQHQVIDLSVGGGTTLSGVDAREIIEDYLADALVAGNNISIVYTDVPTPGLVTISTTESLTVNNVTASGVVNINTNLSIKQLEDSNIAMGFGDTGLSIAAGATHNIFIGQDAGRSITTSDYNIAIGTETLYSNNMDNSNIAIGHQACRNGNTNNSDNVFIGYQSGYQANGDYIICIGPYAGRSAVTNMIAMGNGAGRYATGASNSILIGAQACYWGNGATNSLIIGHFAGYGVSGQSSGDYNTFIGQSTGRGFTSGGRNVCLGHEAGYSFETVSYNVFVGYQSGYDAGVGPGNVFVGAEAGKSATGTDNVFVGYKSGWTNTNVRNVMVGKNAGMSSGAGQQNVYLGWQAGFSNIGNYNVAIGLNAGYYGDGDYNVFLGYNAGLNEAGSHKLYIANSDTATPLIYGEFDTPFLSLNSEIYVAGDTTISGELQVDGDIGTDADLYVDGTINAFGDIEFGGTISGTGDIYCDDLIVSGDVRYVDTFWDDVRVPGLSVEGTTDSGVALRPFGPNGSLQVYQFDPNNTNEVFFTVQIPHTYKEGTNIYPHLHWTPTTASAGDVSWRFRYEWANVGDVFPTYSTINTTATSSGIAWGHQVHGLGVLSGAGKKISSMLVCRLNRRAPYGADTYPDWAAFLEFDFHFEVDSPGSDQPFIN